MMQTPSRIYRFRRSRGALIAVGLALRAIMHRPLLAIVCVLAAAAPVVADGGTSGTAGKDDKLKVLVNGRPLLAWLRDWETPREDAAMTTLIAVDWNEVSVTDGLFYALGQQDHALGMFAAVVIAHHGERAIPRLLDALEGESASGRRYAAYALKKIASASRSLPAEANARLLAALSDSDARGGALLALMRQGLTALRPHIGVLADLLRTGDVNVRRTVCQLLGSRALVELNDVEGVEELHQLLLAMLADEKVGPNAARVLAESKPVTFPLLIGVLDDEEAHVRRLALRALRGNLGIGRQDRELLSPHLARFLALLEDEDPQVRWDAAAMVLFLGGDRRPVLPVMLDSVTRSPSAEARWSAARILGDQAFRDEAARVVPALLAALEDDRQDVRSAAGASLGSFGAAAMDALPALRAKLQADSGRLTEEDRHRIGQLIQEIQAASDLQEP